MRIDTVLLKVASRCNLNCSYCYVYNMGDVTWRDKPKLMSSKTQAAVAIQLKRLVESQSAPFAVVLHGGEPLMLGPQRLESLFETLRQSLPTDCSLNVQTNGALLSPAILDVCNRFGVTISVSLDGPAHVHDKHRVDLRGNPTHSAVVAGVQALRSHPSGQSMFSGVLAVVDPASSPDEVYQYFKDLGAPSIDFLYRDGNWDTLPSGKKRADTSEYGDWMSRILDLYCSDPQPPRIRFLDDLIKLVAGGAGTKEGMGITDFGIVVIDTDGTITKNDTLKSTPLGDRFDKEWSVHTSDLAEVVRSSDFANYHAAQRPTSAICSTCEELSICGGGMVTHRYSTKCGYDNPTVFCTDQRKLISRIRRRLAAHLARRTAA
ncbi:cyclophane-forming radical SAM/SPASM peptide maturase YhhB [Bradyrhizobium sp. BEA-2-5]|uniref:cyclophane-forming radical SAM/SPASM peptide maturase YhhB n=1 Tax=Bradyrhizobium sp. BEA-2-5 TaxID=3080015 RepID=UPI00293E6FDA|nr:cyclophane-forming radical SAM/SPASM peptide maturase YhhB [Bradyrhizobium sp. BEA-2-5]WOH82138.1 cyclophane-forming radical SAM/SPASM peptide maturase YhhB [Bradyrhizobium sp. BEA-2-5]